MPILHWLTRDEDIAASQYVPYRLFEATQSAFSEDSDNSKDSDNSNMLLHGDNLEGLKALLPFYAGRVKCIYIDPPYNTRAAFEHYEDNLEHTRWLAMMWPRLELLRDLLAEDGSIWVSIDDHEAHYLKVLMDEVFGRKKFIANVAWQKRYSRDNNSAIGDVHEHILIYSHNPDEFKVIRNRIDLDERTKRAYSNPNNDPRGPWQSISFTGAEHRENMMYAIVAPNGTVHHPPAGRHWAALEDEYHRLLADGRIWFGKDGTGVPRVIRYLSEVSGLVPWSWWPHEEVGHTGEAKQESNVIFGRQASFSTAKPERLLRRIIHIATDPGDLVLDSFLGSGTTAAVAHKMGRRWIGIEMGEHAVTHCVPRLRKVVAGEQGGISQAVGWRGGGGFRFYRLGPEVFDAQGRIREGVAFPVLAAHVWFGEADRPRDGAGEAPLLGVHGGRALVLLYNGVLGDRRPRGGNVLTRAVLARLRADVAAACPELARGAAGYPMTVYGESSRLAPETLKRERITFRQIPYDVKARA